MKIKNIYPNRCLRAFTLIEMIVVMSIISILVTLSYTGAILAIQSVRKADARNTINQMRNSITAFHTDYRRFPMPDGGTRAGNFVDYATDEAFMEVMLGVDTPRAKRVNTRGQRYFSGKAAKRRGKNTFSRGISYNNAGSGSLWDFWGRKYGVRIDLKNRERLENPSVSHPQINGAGAPNWGGGSAKGPRLIADSAVVWSSGKDLDRSADNLGTW